MFTRVWIGVRLRSHGRQRERLRLGGSADRAVSRAPAPLTVHGTAVAGPAGGVLILGASGAGKSGLALRLIALGARLVADDRVVLSREEGQIVARPPDALAGLIEARGIGLLAAAPLAQAPVGLVVDLDQAPAARLPQPATIAYHGTSVELIFGHAVPNLDAALTIWMQNGRVFRE